MNAAARTVPGSYEAAPSLPASIESEQALLGAILLQNDVQAKIGGFLRVEHFHEELHRRIYTICRDLIDAGKVASPITVRTFLSEADLGGITSGQYLARLAAEATSIAGAIDYARHVHDLAMRRELLVLSEQVAGRARDAAPDDGALRQVEAIEAALQRLRAENGGSSSDTSISAGGGAAEIIARARRIASGEERPQSAQSGIPDLDQMTGGYRAGELWLVAGRPGAGKTAFLTSSSRRAARSGGVLVFELEVPREQIMARYLADICYAPNASPGYGAIMKGELSESDFWRVDKAQERMADLSLVVDTASRLSVTEIRARTMLQKAEMAKRGVRLGVVFIDYLKFVQATDRYRGNRVYEVGEISAGLKQMAKDLGVCVVLLAQLNRAVEGRDDKRPTLSDLRESGDLEADADVVMFLYREAYYLERSKDVRNGDPEAISALEHVRNTMEAIIGKNRSGPTNTLFLWCAMHASSVAAKDRGGL